MLAAGRARRERELAIRVASAPDAGDCCRKMLTESVVLAVAAQLLDRLSVWGLELLKQIAVHCSAPRSKLSIFVV